ncbi:MAG: glycosyltransferase family A protein [Candidatus Marinimicrobia bacterium]|jgi:glycosyltransferase involved in cell wall biosynthesis|nr:glycosyltransferase family A protein [Candidatus Neomarinimicrobiota bacterium]MDP6789608.1 glycosyltransferase family A protein [Candidatus Neomarinimicrobiota bacterium]MDP7071401.1 glycosyltransferase family A protein [Candidatus Neomarinimicrobiota bacterium]
MLSISVIISTYNRIDVLPRALDSVFSQSDPLTDVIVVDDGSDDGTADMVSAKYPEVKLIKQQNTGVSAARNRGIAESKGGWIAFLDSDDEWKPQKLERQIICIAENPDAVLVHTNEIWIRNGKRVNPMNKHQKYGGRIFRKCLPLCVISPSSVMVKKSLFDEVGNFDENMEVCEDYDLWLRICASNQVHYIDEKLIVKYGGHSDQLSAKHWGMDRFRIEALKKIIAQQNLSKEDKRSAVHMLVEKANIVASGAEKRGNTSLFECYNNLADEYGRKFVD